MMSYQCAHSCYEDVVAVDVARVVVFWLCSLRISQLRFSNVPGRNPAVTVAGTRRSPDDSRLRAASPLGLGEAWLVNVVT